MSAFPSEWSYVARCLVLTLVLTFMPLVSAAQAQPSELQRLACHAGIIFSGRVEKIERAAPAASGDMGVVRVTFRVLHALRGATPGSRLVLREWDGLWTTGDRYRIGQNLLLFFYPPSGALGLTTTVGGQQGRIPLADSRLSIAAAIRQIGAPSAAASADCRQQPSGAARPDPRRREQE